MCLGVRGRVGTFWTEEDSGCSSLKVTGLIPVCPGQTVHHGQGICERLQGSTRAGEHLATSRSLLSRVLRYDMERRRDMTNFDQGALGPRDR